MDITETLYVSTRKAWRDWLTVHYKDKQEIWLVSYRKHIGRADVPYKNLPYNDAVEEALCFGWIDSIRKGIDDERYAQRYTPRRAKSSYSQTNKERLARLAAQGKLTSPIEAELSGARPEAYKLPDDICAALKAREGAWEFFQATSPAYQRIRAAYVDHARDRFAEFEKRLNNLAEKSAQGKQFGYGIEDYF